MYVVEKKQTEKKKTTQRNRYNKRSIAQNCAEKHSSVQFFFSFPFHFVSIQSTNYKHKPNKIKKSNSKAFATERKKEEKKQHHTPLLLHAAAVLFNSAKEFDWFGDFPLFAVHICNSIVFVCMYVFIPLIRSRVRALSLDS